MEMSSVLAGLEMNLKELKLPIFLKNYSNLSTRAIEEKMSCEQYLFAISDMEVQERRKKRIKDLLRKASFPRDKLKCLGKLDEHQYRSNYNILLMKQ